MNRKIGVASLGIFLSLGSCILQKSPLDKLEHASDYFNYNQEQDAPTKKISSIKRFGDLDFLCQGLVSEANSSNSLMAGEHLTIEGKNIYYFKKRDSPFRRSVSNNIITRIDLFFVEDTRFSFYDKDLLGDRFYDLCIVEKRGQKSYEPIGQEKNLAEKLYGEVLEDLCSYYNYLYFLRNPSNK